MIRSSCHSLKFLNTRKKYDLKFLFKAYRSFLGDIIRHVWENGYKDYCPSQNKLENSPKYFDNSFLKQFDTWLSARLKQCAGKQALAMLKAATEKRRKQLWKLNDLKSKGEDFRFLQNKINKQVLVIPNWKQANLELDSRFVDFQESKRFLFLRLSSLGNKLQIRIPVQDTKMSNKWKSKGKMKRSVRITEKDLFLLYDIPKNEITGSQIVGADQGLTTVLSMSDGQTTTKCPHGHDLSSIQKKLVRCKKGSKGFRKGQEHRKNYINWALNNIFFDDISEVRLEKIKDLRKGERTSRYLSHWSYTLIKRKLELLSEDKGFILKEVASEFRSQRCSNNCGWVRKGNRRGKTFKCDKCNYVADADLNASTNLSIDLYEVPYWVRLKQINRGGFYWTADGLFTEDWEFIVPNTQKTLDME